MSEATPPQGMERPEAPKRALVSHKNPKFEGRLGAFYGVLHKEYQAEINRRKAALKPGEKVTLPSSYAVEVPDGKDERNEMLVELFGMFVKTLKGLSGQAGQAEGEAPQALDSKQFSEADIELLLEVIKSIMPNPEAPEFTEMVSRRVAVNIGLTKAGFVEALAMLVRFYDALRDASKTVQAAKALAGKVPGANGMVEIKDLPPAQWMIILGRRIIRFDDKASAPEFVAQNQELYEDCITQVGEECRSNLEAVYAIFVERVPKFTREISGRDPEFIQCNWWKVLLNNLLKLDMDDADLLNTELENIRARLADAKDGTEFQNVINNIGKTSEAPTAPETPAA